jgi:hypothetical protein
MSSQAQIGHERVRCAIGGLGGSVQGGSVQGGTGLGLSGSWEGGRGREGSVHDVIELGGADKVSSGAGGGMEQVVFKVEAFKKVGVCRRVFPGPGRLEALNDGSSRTASDRHNWSRRRTVDDRSGDDDLCDRLEGTHFDGTCVIRLSL